MSISVSIDVRGEDDSYYIDDIGTTPQDFVARSQKEGGVWLEYREGMTPFIAWSEIARLWFDDGSSDPTPVKDLTVN